MVSTIIFVSTTLPTLSMEISRVKNVQFILATLLAMENLQFSFANEVPFIPFYNITTTIQFDVTNLDNHVLKFLSHDFCLHYFHVTVLICLCST